MHNIIALFLLLILTTACQTTPVKNVSPAEKLIDLKRQAATAYGQKNWMKALPLYQELNRKIPGDALLWLRTGNVQAHLHQPDNAIASYRKAVKLDSSQAKAWYNMSVLQLRQAANSLTQMLQYVRPGHPLYARAVEMSEATLNILGNGSKSDPVQKN